LKVAFFFLNSCEEVTKSVGGLVIHVFQHLAPCVDSVVLCRGNEKGVLHGVPYIGYGEFSAKEVVRKIMKNNILLKSFFMMFMRSSFYKYGVPLVVRKRVDELISSLGIDVVVPIYPDLPERKYLLLAGTRVAPELLIDSNSYLFRMLSPFEKLAILTLFRAKAMTDKKATFFAPSKRDLDLWFRGPLGKRGGVVYLGVPKGYMELVSKLRGERERGDKLRFYHASVFMTKRDYHHILLASKMLKDEGFRGFEVNLRILVNTEDQKRVGRALEELLKALGVGDVVNLEVTDVPLSSEEYVRFHLNNDVLLWTGKMQAYGITPLEALYAGNPAVVTERAGVVEVLRGIKGIRVYNPDDVRSLARSMRWYLENNKWVELRDRYPKFVEFVNELTCRMFRSTLEALLQVSSPTSRTSS